MKSIVTRAALAATLLTSTALAASAEPVFNRIASFPVASNLPADKDGVTETSAEIIAASEDGNTIIYSDSPLGALGFVDITDASAPKPLGTVMLDGEPTSVATGGDYAIVGVNTSEDYTNTSGKLVAINIKSHEEAASCDLGGQPDSVAVSKDGSFATVAIENERDENLGDGGLPQMPAGDLVTVALKDGVLDCGSLKHISVSGLADVFGEDPEPEFVDVNGLGEIVLTLQENNYLVIVDGKTGEVKNHFSAGSVDVTGVDIEKDGKLDFTGSLTGVAREPDSVKWIDNDRFVIANEGDWKGGSRGFTIFNKFGDVAFDSGNSFEHEMVRIGHYPEKRSGKKGVEPEGVAVAEFDGEKLIFIMSERGSAIGVYKDTGGKPELLQMLPSGIAPESAVAIPSRGLLVSANEADLVEDGAARSHVMIFERKEGEASYPMIVSEDQDGQPLGWGALSGLAPVPGEPGTLYAVNDSFYSAQPTIFEIDATAKPSKIVKAIRVTRDGQPAEKLDQEGITNDGNGGFWVSSEGNAKKEVPHALYHVGADGAIMEMVELPEALLKNEERFGFEGVTMVDGTLWMAVQREWKDDEKGFVKLVSYNPSSKEWGAVRYPLDKPAVQGWVGLSEIVTHDDHVYIIERDNQIGTNAAIKKLYRVAVADMKAAPLGGDLPVVTKELAHDFMADLKATNGYVVDKIEGFTFDADGKAFAVTDNDGVDDSSGETMFFEVNMTATN